MLDRVAASVHRHAMLRKGDRVGVAVSGGADSICLLHLLRELAPELELRLEVLHLDHRLRGEESAADAGFVRELAASLSLPFHLEERDVAGLAAASGDNLEQAARRARQEFFSGFLKPGLLDRVATGHTRSDQAETVLFRFLRGAATAGLAGVRPVTSEGLIRPLLEISRAEVEAWLAGRGIGFRQDSTNLAAAFARTRIRHHLLPLLAREWNPAIEQTLALTARWAQAEEDWWAREMDRLEAACLIRRGESILLKTDDLLQIPEAPRRRLVRRAIERAKGDLRAIGFDHVEGILQIAASAEGHGRLQAPGLDVFRSFEWLRLSRPGLQTLETRNFRLPVAAPGQVRLPGGGLLCLEIVQKAVDSSDPRYNSQMGGLDWDRLAAPLELRNWRPGDGYHPLGHSGMEKLKTLFHRSRVPLWERSQWPVITSGGEIVWSRQFGPAAPFAASPASRNVLLIRDFGESPPAPDTSISCGELMAPGGAPGGPTEAE